MLRLGIDLGGSKIEGVVLDHTGQILRRERRVTPAAQGYDAIIDAIVRLIGDLEAHVGGACHVGIGAPGALSSRTGGLKNSNTVCLNGKPLPTDLEHALQRPIRLANDANCFALAEAQDGAGRGQPVVFGVIMGTGVGGGVVVNGRLLDGLQHIAGEWGHNVLDTDGPPCYCGRHGCVETFLSGPGLARDYREYGGAPLSADAIVARAAAGESMAEAAMQRLFERFGRALAAVINILDPHVVVLGGGMSNIERLYTDGRAAVARYVFNDELRTPILRNVHGDSAGVLGAAQLWPVE
jgi:fructokinase